MGKEKRDARPAIVTKSAQLKYRGGNSDIKSGRAPWKQGSDWSLLSTDGEWSTDIGGIRY